MFAEYEEIYNAQEKQLRNMSLDSYGPTNENKDRAHARSFALNECNSSYPHDIDPKVYQQPKPMPPRPRSADFLEYESKKQMRKMANLNGSEQFKNRLPSRPKSSLDINSSIDNYYYSEASYAAKMRQSSVYLQNRQLFRPTTEDPIRNTLRYENERKRLTNEFQNYTANNPLNSNSLPTNFQRPSDARIAMEEWRYSPLKRKGVYSTDERSMSFRNIDDITTSNPNKSSASEGKRKFIHFYLQFFIEILILFFFF